MGLVTQGEVTEDGWWLELGAHRAAVRDGTLVTFSATLGTLDPIDARTSNGRASVSFSAGSASGTATITAFSGAAISDAVDVLVLPASP